MRRIPLWLCAVLICVSCANAQQKISTKNAPHASPQDQKFVDVEKTLWEAWKNKDRRPYEDLLSDKFFEVDMTRTYDKTTEISYMDKCDLKDYAILDPQVSHLNHATVLLTYKATVHDICEGQPVPEHLIINIVFVRHKRKWLKVLDSEVPSFPTANLDTDQKEVMGVQDTLIGAYLHHDYAVLNRVLADDYTYIDDDGFVLNKQQILVRSIQ
jgi:hypothetical protein